MGNKDLIITKIKSIFDDLKSDYKYGGSEDDDGNLCPGNPDFDFAFNKIILSLNDNIG